MSADFSTYDLNRACDELATILTHAHGVLDLADTRRARANGGVEECTAGLCYESVAA